MTQPDTPNAEPDELSLLKIEEVADLFRVSKRTIEELIRSGELHSIKVRRNRRVPRSAAIRYLADARV